MEVFNNVLNIIELVILLLFALCVFVGRNTTWNFWMRIGIIASLVLINAVQFVIGLIFEKNFVDDLIMLILWEMDAFLYYPDFKAKISQLHKK